jgi:hypothetical protein
VAKRQQPESLNEQMGSVHAAGQFAKGAFRIARGDLMGAADIASGAAMRDTSRFLKEQQTTDALIKRAFAAYRGGPPEAVVMPVRRPVRGLIEKGSTPMGSGPDTSYVRGVPATPAVSHRKALPPAREVREAGPAPDTSYVRSEPAQYGEKWTPPEPESRITPSEPTPEARQGVANLVKRKEAEVVASAESQAFDISEITVGKPRSGRNFIDIEVKAPQYVTSRDKWALIEDTEKLRATIRGRVEQGKKPSKTDKKWSVWSQSDKVVKNGLTFDEAVDAAKRYVDSAKQRLPE